MFDDIPVTVWLSISLLIMAYLPASHVFRHIAHAPSRRDITLPREDLSWRTPRALFISLAALAALLAVGVYIHTPAAERFARSPEFMPLLMAGLGVFSLSTVVRGLLNGHVSPLVRGLDATYERESQPKRFWASWSWNALLGCGFLWLSIVAINDQRVPCFDDREYETPQDSRDACTALINDPSTDRDDLANLHFKRGYANHRMNDFRRALADYSRALELDPSDSYSLYNRGLIRMRMGTDDLALEDITASLKLRPDNVDAHLWSGEILLHQNKLDAAINAFSQAYEIAPKNASALASRGMAYAWKADAPHAERDFAAARRIDPENPVIDRGRGLLAVNLNDPERAIPALNAALARDPEDMFALQLRSQAYGQLGDRQKADADAAEVQRLQQARLKAS